MKNKKILFLILFIFIIILSKSVFAAENPKLEMDIGEERSFTFSDLEFNGNIPTKIISASSSNEQILSVSEIETGFLFWKVISEVKIKGVSIGDTQLTITYNYNTTSVDPYTGTMTTITQQAFKIYDVKVVDKTAEEIKNLENKVEDAEEYVDNVTNAYKNVPGKEATASEIDTFLKSTANVIEDLPTQEEKDKMWDQFEANVNKELASTWFDTITKAMSNDRVYRDLYAKSRETLFWYINYEDDTYQGAADDLNDQFDTNIEANEDTISEYMELIATIEAEARKKHDNFIDIFDDPTQYNPTTEAPVSQEFINKISIILTIITNIGMVIAVLIPAILGVKYMLASVDERAEYKKDMVPYLIGAALLFGILSIVKALQALGESINNIS